MEDWAKAESSNCKLCLYNFNQSRPLVSSLDFLLTMAVVLRSISASNSVTVIQVHITNK